MKTFLNSLRAKFNLVDIVFVLLCVAFVVPFILKLARKAPVIGNVVKKAENIAAMLIAALLISLGIGATANAEVITKGGFQQTRASAAAEGSYTNAINFGWSARQRWIGSDGTNQFGITTNGLPFAVTSSGSNSIAMRMHIIGVTNHGAGTVTYHQYVNGFLARTNSTGAF